MDEEEFVDVHDTVEAAILYEGMDFKMSNVVAYDRMLHLHNPVRSFVDSL